MTVRLTNAQREAPVDLALMGRVARRAVRRLRQRARGELCVTFLSARRMRTLNRRFLRHDWTTDVLSFRYDANGARGPAGDILIAPRLARRYARAHRLPYAEELSRYVVHGILHWDGHTDETPAQQRTMRRLEDQLLGLEFSALKGTGPRRGPVPVV